MAKKKKIKQGKERSSLVSKAGRIDARRHQADGLPDDLLRFSFRHFSVNEKFPIPDNITYISEFLERLKSLSEWKVKDFRQNRNQSLRNHIHDWNSTSEPSGYAHLTEQLRQCEAWQFSLTANEHGRVHGILIDEVFYVVWLDVNHALYP